MTPASAQHFERLFVQSPDPWGTFVRRDEKLKRNALLSCLPHRCGQVLELGCGNGSNTVALAARADRVIAVDGSPAALSRTRDALSGTRNASAKVRLLHCRFPAPLPQGRFDAVIISELLYYLRADALRTLAADTGRILRPGGRLVLVHHRIDFPDSAVRPWLCEPVFLAALNRPIRCVRRVRTAAWQASAWGAARRAPQP